MPGLLLACKLGSQGQESKAESNSVQAFIQKSQNIISAHSLVKTVQFSRSVMSDS